MTRRSLLGLLLLALLGLASSEPAVIRASIVGGWRRVDPSDPTVVELAKFAVAEQNKKLGGSHRLEYSRVLDAKKQVVQGVMFLLTVEAVAEKNNPARYQAKVWVKEWENFRKLMEFNPVSS